MRLLFLSLMIVFHLMAACSDNKDEGSGVSGDEASDGNINVNLTSTDFALSPDGFALAEEEGCECSQPGTSQGGSICGSRPDGKCYTPTAMKGFFNTLYLSGVGSSNDGSARLMGGGNKYTGLESVFRTGFFDVSESVFLDGDDTLQIDGGSFDLVDMRVQTIEYQFGAAGKFFNVRIPLVNLPTTTDPEFEGCIDEGGLGESAKYVDLYSAPTTVTAGDILVCVTDSASDSCADADFKWTNSSGELLSTRPSSPLRLTGSAAFEPSTCTSGADYPEVTWGSMALYAQLAEDAEASAEIIEGKKLYTAGGKSGNTLNTTVDLDLSNQLYVPSSLSAAYLSTDYAANGATILGALDRITLRQIYQLNTRSSSSVNIDSDNMFQAAVSFELSNKSEEDDGDVEDLSETIPEN
jgi:hypothetical protein